MLGSQNLALTKGFCEETVLNGETSDFGSSGESANYYLEDMKTAAAGAIAGNIVEGNLSS